MNTAVQSTAGQGHRRQRAERPGLLGSLLRRVRRERARRLARRELIGLPDHLLRDIGIERGDIPRVAAGLAARRYPAPREAQAGLAIAATATCRT